MKKILLFLCIVATSFVQAKEIRLIVPYSAGGTADRVARTVQSKLNDTYNVVIEYKTGAGGTVAWNYVAQYKENETVLLLASNAITDGVALNNNSRYNLAKDFIAVKHLGSTPYFLIVSNNDSANTFNDLVKESKIKPITYGGGGIGSGQHIAGALIGSQFNNFVHVPYKGGSQALVDVMSGNIKFLMESPMVIGPLIEGKKIKALAVAAPSRVPGFEQVPTFKELGVDDYNYTRWFVLLANSTADRQEVQNIIKRLQASDVTEGLESLGMSHFIKNLDSNFLIEQHNKVQKIVKYIKLE